MDTTKNANMYPSPMPSQFSNSNRRIFDTHGPSLRVYQVWKGRNRFFFGGRLVFGPDARSLFITILLISAPVILFCTVVSQELVNELPHRIGNLILLSSAVFTIYIIILLLLTSGRDPGIIPRNPYPPEAEDEGDASSSISTEWASCQGVVPTLPPTKDVTVNGVVVKVKYCPTCMLYRPPRCSHCSICNNCVERFDHHCPWVGQCIGKRNYRFFFMFVSSTTMLCLYVFAMCWVNIKHIMKAYHCNLWKALMKSPLSGILILYTFIAAWFVGGLTLFHLYLIFTNQTTYENFRYQYDRNTNPYNLGCFLNTAEIFFSKIPSSKNKFREKVKGGSSPVFTPSMSSVCRGLSPEMVKMTSPDIEKGKPRVCVEEEFEEDMQKRRHIESQRYWDEKGNWESTTDDTHMFTPRFGIDNT